MRSRETPEHELFCVSSKAVKRLLNGAEALVSAGNQRVCGSDRCLPSSRVLDTERQALSTARLSLASRSEQAWYEGFPEATRDTIFILHVE